MSRIFQKIEKKLNYQKTIHKLRFVSIVSKIVLRIRRLFGLKKTLLVKRRLGVDWELNLHEAIDFCLFAFNNYEPELLNFMKRKLKKNAILIDIGANIGAHTLPMAKHLSQGKVYALEPTDYAYKKLVKNIELNKDIRNIKVEKVFLTNSEMEKVETVSSSWNISNIEDPKRNKLDGGFAKSVENANFLTFDDWFESSGLNQIDFIKLDVDGHEVDVLKGAKKVLSKFHPHLFLEFSPIHFTGHKYQFSDLVDILIQYDYQIEDMFGQKLDLNIEFLEKYIPYGSLVNVFAYYGAADKD